MKILGIDPGTATTGYGVIQIEEEKFYSLKYGLIETNKNGSPERRLFSIYDQLNKIMRLYEPDELAIEKVFFATNAKTAIRVGQAQGVILLSAGYFKVPVYEYSPMTIKKIVAGNGRADKNDVQKHVRRFLGNGVHKVKGKKTHFDNEADALAVALCHMIKRKDKMFVIGGD